MCCDKLGVKPRGVAGQRAKCPICRTVATDRVCLTFCYLFV